MNDLLVKCEAGTLNKWLSNQVMEAMYVDAHALGSVLQHIHATAAEGPLNVLQKSYWAIHGRNWTSGLYAVYYIVHHLFTILLWYVA